jgi:SAM-dependent methyltransferase
MVLQSKINMNNLTELETCLACGSTDLELALDLTTQPLANSYIKDIADESSYPLAVNRCTHCCHLQLTHVVDPEIIYKNYLYVSGTSKTYLEYLEWFARFAREYIHQWPSTVLDIGCNDGSQLDAFKRLGLTTYGIDPAENLYPTSSANHTIWCDFFGPELAAKIDQKFDIVVAQNSFAHNPDPLAYLTALKPLLAHGGLFFIQTSQADMVANGEFDTIYHEHVNFYNINSMNKLCQRAGMHLVDVQKTPIHGTSYVFVVSAERGNPARIENLIAREKEIGLLDADFYHKWANNIAVNMSQLKAELTKLKDNGYRLIGYGAAAKGNTVLNYIKYPLDCVIDDNPLKQDHYTPGQHCPIVSSEYLDNLSTTDRVAFVPLAWNFYTEIKRRILERRSNTNDVFVKYFPEVTVE